ncbi:MAG: beta strand repeat-containing protein, partial [Prosthecobacter sp.]
CYGTLTLAKLDASIWQIDAVSTYSGATQIDDGTLRIGAANVLPATTAVRLGTGTTAGVLDLNGFDQTIGSLTSSTNSTTATNQILVATGKTLTINGAVTLGANVDVSTTLVTASGGGAIVVNSAGANFQVGGATGGTNENTATVDFSGLSSFTANLGTGTFRIGDANTASGTPAPATMKLAATNTITAAAIRVGDGSGFGNNHTLTLGSGVNTLNADTLNVGSAGANIRSSGTVNFDAGDTTGSVQVRASDGTGRATINMVNSSGNTAADMDSTVNLAGHTANILASTLTMATRTTGTGVATAALTFDQGTLDVTTLNMASRTGAGTGNATATLNLGDSAAPGSPTTTIGTVNMAVNTSAGGTVTSNMVITGGTVNIGTGSGTAINMANAAASRTSVSSINLTGGTLSATGNIVRTGGAGTETATTTVNGGTLNMNGNSIGTAGAQIALQAQSGTLSGLSELNGGGLLTKSTTGALSMGNGNTYTGGTLVSDGTLLATNSTGSATGSGAVTVAAAGTLGGTGSIIAASGNNITINGTLDAGMPTSSSGSALALTVGGAGSLALSGTTLFQLFTNDNLGTLNGVTAADRVVVNAPNWSNVVFGGSSSLTITTGLTATTFVAGDSWRIFDWTGVAAGTAPLQGTNGFNSIIAPTLDVNLGWDYSNLFTTGTISVIVIPEPSRALLLMLGLLGLMMRRRRN